MIQNFSIVGSLPLSFNETVPKIFNHSTESGAHLVYHEALHNNFFVARDLLQMSQLTSDAVKSSGTTPFLMGSRTGRVVFTFGIMQMFGFCSRLQSNTETIIFTVSAFPMFSCLQEQTLEVQSDQRCKTWSPNAGIGPIR